MRTLAWAALALASVGAVLQPVTAQVTAGAVPAAGTSSAFADPWAVRFQHIYDALNGKAGAYATEQIRRERNSSGVLHGTLERLLFRPADAGSKAPSRFRLEFRGFEGQQLNSADFARYAAEFEGRAGFTFQFKDFQITDPVQAEANYDLVFLARATRRTAEGLVDVYRMAVVPKGWDRSAWLLELDTRTGYPIYTAAYATDANKAVVLASERVVTSFLSGVRVPSGNDPSWWAPLNGVEVEPTVQLALRKALVQSSTYAVPVAGNFLPGVRLISSEVHINPYDATRSAVLRYSDGVDRQLVVARNVPRQARGAEDLIGYIEEQGFTQCVFTHLGVQFRIVGRSAGENVRNTSIGIFATAIRDLR